MNQQERNPITGEIIGAAIEVHKYLGPGLLESAYQRCMELELQDRGLEYQVEVPVPLSYKGHQLDVGYRLDLVVQGVVVVELKAVEKLLPVHEAQLLTYLKLTKLRVGLLINFNQAVLINGLKRFVL